MAAKKEKKFRMRTSPKIEAGLSNGKTFIKNDAGEHIFAEVKKCKFEGISALIIESRGGGKGSDKERNTDYIEGIGLIFSRIRKLGIPEVRVYSVSKSKKYDCLSDRLITFEGQPFLDLTAQTITDDRARLSKALRDSAFHQNERILISGLIADKQWDSVISGTLPRTEDTPKSLNLFDPHDEKDAREKTLRAINVRRGQPKFRRDLFEAYGGTCAVTGWRLGQVLEAAHIMPYKGEHTNYVQNGLLLRSDIHTLFDLHLIGIDENFKVRLSALLESSDYWGLEGTSIVLPVRATDRPDRSALAHHFKKLK